MYALLDSQLLFMHLFLYLCQQVFIYECIYVCVYLFIPVFIYTLYFLNSFILKSFFVLHRND